VKCLIFFPDHNQIWIFSTIFIKIPNTKVTELRPVAAAVVCEDGRTDTHDEDISAFRHYANRP